MPHQVPLDYVREHISQVQELGTTSSHLPTSALQAQKGDDYSQTLNLPMGTSPMTEGDLDFNEFKGQDIVMQLDTASLNKVSLYVQSFI